MKKSIKETKSVNKRDKIRIVFELPVANMLMLFTDKDIYYSVLGLVLKSFKK